VGPRAVLKRKIPSPRREPNPRTPIVQTVEVRYIIHIEVPTCLKFHLVLRSRMRGAISSLPPIPLHGVVLS
jgi:hypothetical protein